VISAPDLDVTLKELHSGESAGAGRDFVAVSISSAAAGGSPGSGLFRH
jgi:hypothetical protein